MCHGRGGIGERAASELIALARRREIGEDEGEIVSGRIDFRHMGAGRVDRGGGRQDAVEIDFALIEEMLRPRFAAGWIGGGELADDAGRNARFETAIGQVETIAIGNKAIADTVAGKIGNAGRVERPRLLEGTGHPRRIDFCRIGHQQAVVHRSSPCRLSARFGLVPVMRAGHP